MDRRHVTTALTMLVLVGVLVLALLLGAKALFAPLPAKKAGDTSASPTCAATKLKKGQKIKAEQVVVSVFNAGSRGGLAGQTLKELSRRGFGEGSAGNAPSDVTVRRVQVWTTKENDPAARLVALQFGPHTPVKVTSTDLGPGVDVIVGDGLHGLRHAPASLVVKKPQKVCLSSSP